MGSVASLVPLVVLSGFFSDFYCLYMVLWVFWFISFRGISWFLSSNTVSQLFLYFWSSSGFIVSLVSSSHWIRDFSSSLVSSSLVSSSLVSSSLVSRSLVSSSLVSSSLVSMLFYLFPYSRIPCFPDSLILGFLVCIPGFHVSLVPGLVSGWP